MKILFHSLFISMLCMIHSGYVMAGNYDDYKQRYKEWYGIYQLKM